MKIQRQLPRILTSPWGVLHDPSLDGSEDRHIYRASVMIPDEDRFIEELNLKINAVVQEITQGSGEKLYVHWPYGTPEEAPDVPVNHIKLFVQNLRMRPTLMHRTDIVRDTDLFKDGAEARVHIDMITASIDPSMNQIRIFLRAAGIQLSGNEGRTTFSDYSAAMENIPPLRR